QWPAERQGALMAGIAEYFAARQHPLTDQIRQHLLALYHTARQQHQRHYLKKQFRNCTMTAYRKNLWQEAAWRRGAVTAMQPGSLAAAMQGGQPLKLGNSATVMLAELAGQ